MKYILVIVCFFTLQLSAQQPAIKKTSTIDFHVFYNDFSSAQQIRTTSLSNVIIINYGAASVTCRWDWVLVT